MQVDATGFVAIGVLVLAALVLGLGLTWWARSAVEAGRFVEPDLAAPPRDAPQPERPWWGNPWLWVAVCAVFVVLGVVVWPGLFGGTFLFLPFIWVGRPRRPADPRSNGHSARGADRLRGG